MGPELLIILLDRSNILLLRIKETIEMEEVIYYYLRVVLISTAYILSNHCALVTIDKMLISGH